MHLFSSDIDSAPLEASFASLSASSFPLISACPESAVLVSCACFGVFFVVLVGVAVGLNYFRSIKSRNYIQNTSKFWLSKPRR